MLYEEIESIKKNVDLYRKLNKQLSVNKLSRNLHIMLQWLNPKRMFVFWDVSVEQPEPYNPDQGNLRIIPGKGSYRKEVKKSEGDEKEIISEVSEALSNSVLSHPWNKDKRIQIDEIVN